MSLTGAVLRVQSNIRGIAAVKKAPDYPPEQANLFPFAIAYPASGSYETGVSGARLGMQAHAIGSEVHVQRKNLPTDVERIVGLADSIIAVLKADITLDSNVQRIDSIAYSFGPSNYGGVDTLAYTFTINVVIMDDC